MSDYIVPDKCEDCPNYEKNHIVWKKLLKSKTFWFSILIIILSLLTGFSNLDIIIEYPHLASLIGVLIGTLTLILRLITSTSVFDIKIPNIVEKSTQNGVLGDKAISEKKNV